MNQPRTFIINSNNILFSIYSAVITGIPISNVYWFYPDTIINHWVTGCCFTVVLFFYFYQHLCKPYPFNLLYQESQWHIYDPKNGDQSALIKINLSPNYWLSERLLILPFRVDNNRKTIVIIASIGSMPNHQLRQMRQIIHLNRK